MAVESKSDKGDKSANRLEEAIHQKPGARSHHGIPTSKGVGTGVMDDFRRRLPYVKDRMAFANIIATIIICLLSLFGLRCLVTQSVGIDSSQGIYETGKKLNERYA